MKSNEEPEWIPRLFPPQFHWYNEVIPNKQHNCSKCQSMNQHIGPLRPRILQRLSHCSVRPLLCPDLLLPAKWNLPHFICRICHSTSFSIKKSHTNLFCIFQFCRVSNKLRHYKKSCKIRKHQWSNVHMLSCTVIKHMLLSGLQKSMFKDCIVTILCFFRLPFEHGTTPPIACHSRICNN